MTHERLQQLLENPAMLAGMPYEELKTLALSYPYAHNLRYLLALKSHNEQRPDAQRTLTTASVYSLNRSRLYTLIAPLKVVQNEEVLELRPIEAIQKTLETRVPLTVQFEEEEALMAMSNPVVQTETPAVQPVQAEPEEQLQEKPWVHFPSVSQKTSFGVWISQFNPPHLPSDGQRSRVDVQPLPWNIAPKPVVEKPLPKPVEPVQTEPENTEEEPLALGEDPVRPEDIQKNTESGEQANANNAAQRLAERSVQENKEIASETLARLYWRQGHKEKSLAMYERLCLLFPEKSAYFAAEIDKLKK